MILSYSAGGSVVFIEFDATLKESVRDRVTVTRHHVEVGADVADHARPGLDSIEVDVFVSNTPINSPKTNTDGVVGAVAPLLLQIPARVQLPISLPGVGAVLTGIGALDTVSTQKVNILQFDGEMNRIRSIYNELKLLSDSSTLVNVSMGLREYTNMVIESISTMRTVKDGAAQVFSLVMNGIRFVDSKIVAVSAGTNQSKTTKGVKPGKTTEQPLESMGRAIKENVVKNIHSFLGR